VDQPSRAGALHREADLLRDPPRPLVAHLGLPLDACQPELVEAVAADQPHGGRGHTGAALDLGRPEADLAHPAGRVGQMGQVVQADHPQQPPVVGVP